MPNKYIAQGKRAAILQSNYIPWKGYFDLINSVDEFIIYDDAQFTKRDWRNRNKIKTAQGIKWLTIPVEVKGKYLQKIKDTHITDPSWAEKHWKTLIYCYKKAPYFNNYSELFSNLYREASKMTYLSEVNYLFITEIIRLLGIKSVIRWSSEFELQEGRNERLLGMCLDVGATTYLSGPSANSYLNVNFFSQNGVTVEWMDYSGYLQYEQLFGAYEGGVTILDLLFNVGDQTTDYMKTFEK